MTIRRRKPDEDRLVPIHVRVPAEVREFFTRAPGMSVRVREALVEYMRNHS